MYLVKQQRSEVEKLIFAKEAKGCMWEVCCLVKKTNCPVTRFVSVSVNEWAEGSEGFERGKEGSRSRCSVTGEL